MFHQPNGWFCWWCPKSILKFHQSHQSMSVISSQVPLQSRGVCVTASCLFLWFVSYITIYVCVCVCVWVFRVCVHTIESLLKYLDSVCSCGTIYHVSWLAGWGKHKSSPPPCRIQQWANCPNIQDLWGAKHPGVLEHITYARFGRNCNAGISCANVAERMWTQDTSKLWLNQGWC